jgi:hypothetical protein
MKTGSRLVSVCGNYPIAYEGDRFKRPKTVASSRLWRDLQIGRGPLRRLRAAEELAKLLVPALDDLMTRSVDWYKWQSTIGETITDWGWSPPFFPGKPGRTDQLSQLHITSERDRGEAIIHLEQGVKTYPPIRGQEIFWRPGSDQLPIMHLKPANEARFQQLHPEGPTSPAWLYAAKIIGRAHAEFCEV